MNKHVLNMFRASGANIQKQTNSANGVPAHPVSPQVSPCHDLYSDIPYNMYCIVLYCIVAEYFDK